MWESENTIDRVTGADISALHALSPQFQQKAIRALARHGGFPLVAQFFIEYNARIYRQRDRRVQCQQFFASEGAHLPSPLVRIVLRFLGSI